MNVSSPLRKRRPTQADVASLAAVSQVVVSAVLNPASRISVSPDTRQRVLAAVDELGYVPNPAARSLRTQRTMTIAGVIPDISNPFYPAFQRGIQDVAECHGYDLLIANTDGVPEKERKAVRMLAQGRVDGIVLSPLHLVPDDIRPAIDGGVALVVFGALHDLAITHVDRLAVDNEHAAHTAVSHLIDRGHTRIAMIAGEADTPPRLERVRGYQRALADRALPHDEILIRGGDFTQAGGYQTMHELLKLQPRPTAVFAANDLMAMGALVALREAALRVPEDMAIVGFDDIPAAELVSPPLTTVAQFPNRLGQRAAEMLFERLAGKAPEAGRSEAMPFELIVRAST
jgi:LacI family transcriptional regulator